MGNTDSKLNFRKAVVQLTSKSQNIDASDERFWSQFWTGTVSNVNDIYTLIPSCEIRALREEAPTNLASLCFRLVEKIAECAESTFMTERERNSVLNCVRILTRLVPYIFEEPEWRGFFWSDSPVNKTDRTTFNKNSDAPLAQTLLNSLISLLFMPDFTVTAHKKGPKSEEERVKTIDSCEYIWEAGVGFSQSPSVNLTHDFNRTELLKLILATFSETIYLPPLIEYHVQANLWITYFTSFKNQHALPLFTSLLNIVFAYDPVGYGLPYNYLMFTDSREQLVEVSCQLLCVALETNISINNNTNSNRDHSSEFLSSDEKSGSDDATSNSNLFISYLSRIHRDEDFSFILKGFCRLLNNPMTQTFLPGSCKKINFFQELLILFWKFCDINKRFMYYVLKSTEILDILVPILYFLVDARADTSKTGLIHIGVFILLLLSGERNFGVRLNKPYVSRVPMDIPVFSGTHADLLIISFHKLITSTNQRLQPLYDCLLTIIVNISPYLKTLCMVSSTKLLHLLDAFSTPAFLLANANNYYLVFFLLEILNNMIQYQFDGNANLIYTIIRKRQCFFQLLNLPTDAESIEQIVERQTQSSLRQQPSKDRLLANTSSVDAGFSPSHVTPAANTVTSSVAATATASTSKSMDGAIPAREAEPGTLKTTLAETPSVLNMTEKTSTTTTSTNQFQQQQQQQPLKNFTSSNNDDGSFSYYTTNSSSNTGQQPVTSQLVNLNLSGDRQQDSSANSSGSESAAPAPPSPPRPAPLVPKPVKSSPERLANNWRPTGEWVSSWKSKLPLQTIMRLLQVLVPQVEKICIDKGLTDESEILKFLQNGTLVGLLPVPHPILIRKYQPNYGTIMWFKTYMWGVIYLRNLDPPIWYDTDVKLFEIQRV